LCRPRPQAPTLSSSPLPHPTTNDKSPLSPSPSTLFPSEIKLHEPPRGQTRIGGDQAERPRRQGVRGFEGHQQLRAPVRGQRGARGGAGQGGARRQDQADQVHRAHFPVKGRDN